MLSALRLPERLSGTGEADLRRRLLEKYGSEVGGGLGRLAGRIWRVGPMGESARLANVERLLCALRREIG
jgi:alanine-glyoxylate transaminase/serine-glyoxylate transaminase/serine-pyruvate transaminase